MVRKKKTNELCDVTIHFFQYKYDLDMFHQIHKNNLGLRNPTSDENMTCNKMHKVRKVLEKKNQVFDLFMRVAVVV